MRRIGRDVQKSYLSFVEGKIGITLFFFGALLIGYNSYLLGVWCLLLASIFNAFRQNVGFFSPLSLIPIFATIQLLFSFVFLSQSSLNWVNYGPLGLVEYMQVAPFGVLCCMFPLFLASDKAKHNLSSQLTRPESKQLVSEMLRWGLIAEMLNIVFGSVAILGALLWYVSMLWKLAIPIAFIDSGQRRLSAVLAAMLFAQCFLTALYWEFIMVTVLGVLYGVSKGRISFFKLVIIIVTGFSFILTTQTFKHIQRSSANIEYSGELTNIFASLLDNAQSAILFESLMGRLNQGVLDSFVYERCSNGKCQEMTILNSAIGVFAPRALFPDKPSFSSEKLQTLGGYHGMGSSFMTLSGCAEAYANFGLIWGGVFMLFFSFGLKAVHRVLVRRLSKASGFLVVLPFYHVLRVEVDFYHWFTSMLYGAVVLFLFSMHMDKKVYLENNDLH